MSRNVTKPLIALTLVFAFAAYFLFLKSATDDHIEVLRVGIAPYQDMAMLAAAKPESIDKKHNINMELVSMQWADLTPAVASAGDTVDVAFASLIQFIAQEPSLNANSSDPLVFFYPAYVFRGGAFVSFNEKVPTITSADLGDPQLLKRFLDFKFAVQSTSSFEILLYDLALRANVDFSKIERVDIDSSDGLLAAVNGSVDVAAAGLTQKNEALQQGGRSVLEMEALGQVDIAGFIAKRSTLEARRDDVERLVHVWVDTIDYVMSDIDQHSNHSLAYLRKQSSTKYTIEEYKTALSQEWLPRSIAEMQKVVVEPTGKYYYDTIKTAVSKYYIDKNLVSRPPENIELIRMSDQ